MNPESMKILLTIEQRTKAVPYPRVEHAASTNIGFQDLKGTAPDVVAAIPEARDSPPLQKALLAINDAETDFFTVGCEKSLNEGQRGFWKKGYLEFAYDYVEAVADAQAYFILFFHFQQARKTRAFVAEHSVQFAWELQGAQFTKQKCTGFTCCVWITTGAFDTAAECERVWEAAVDLVTTFIVSRRVKRPNTMTRIYGTA